MSEVSDQLPADPISAVGVVTSPSKVPDGYFVVAQTTDGCDADLWKDGLFKSKVTRYLCFSRKAGPDVVVDVKLTDIKDALPESFTFVQETMDTKEPATRKRRICVKMSPREAAKTAVCDIQIVAKSKYHLVNYTCIGEINNMGIWYVMRDLPQLQSSQKTSSTTQLEVLPSPTRKNVTRPHWDHYSSGVYTMTVCLIYRRSIARSSHTWTLHGASLISVNVTSRRSSALHSRERLTAVKHDPPHAILTYVTCMHWTNSFLFVKEEFNGTMACD
ncbi:multivesicular body subunit 12Bb isoform X1 [Mugil cephalus]|uniref:multivesicular body subunit 12Bb isoform X1 n=1 Tax=Mugil cephalus TaxID=48193 RepID=UPI001FB6F17D|nr:multivesicular body subunit 12Bb isoform X1 [Mugil cephalus]